MLQKALGRKCKWKRNTNRAKKYSMYAKLKKGSQYKAYFSGIASTYDNKQTFMVAQDAHITFTYR